MTRSTLPLLVLVVACDGCGGSTASGDGEDLPRAIREMDEHDYAEVQPFDGWSVQGVRLYRMSWAVPDHSVSYIIGIDESGALLRGPDLMRRFGDLPPEELATRAIGVLLGEHGRQPLSPDSERTFGSEAEWEVVAAPRMEGDTLVFYMLEGEMAPGLVERRLDTRTYGLETQDLIQVIVDRGDIAVVGGPRCVAIARCGCWDGCVRAETVRVPEGRRGTHRLVDGEAAGTLLDRHEECAGTDCFRVCRVDAPDAHCDDGALAPVDEECEESCPPSEAPYHCETLESACRRVEHPGRHATAG